MPPKSTQKNKSVAKSKTGPKGPFTWTRDFIDDLVDKMEQYIEGTAIPILEEFTTQNKIWVQRLYEFEEFAEPIKRLKAKKIAGLERQGLTGNINPTMAIWGLKQLGQTDKQEISGTIENKITKMSKEEREAKKAELLNKLNKENDRR